VLVACGNAARARAFARGGNGGGAMRIACQPGAARLTRPSRVHPSQRGELAYDGRLRERQRAACSTRGSGGGDASAGLNAAEKETGFILSLSTVCPQVQQPPRCALSSHHVLLPDVAHLGEGRKRVS
jgi:hypothetical protein